MPLICVLGATPSATDPALPDDFDIDKFHKDNNLIDPKISE